MVTLSLGSVSLAEPLVDGFRGGQPVKDGPVSHANDPLEPVNRGVFFVNRLLDGLIIKPAAQVYRGVMPLYVRQRIGFILSNFVTPLYSLNFCLQGEGDKALQQLGRFLINTSCGALGVFDVATSLGFPKEESSFTKTFATYGMPSGPYVMLPILGPSDMRDTLGKALSFVFDPFQRIVIHEGKKAWGHWRAGTNIVHERSLRIKDLDSLEKHSLDYYDALRDIYLQKARQIK